MENFYSSNSPLLRANSAAVALRSICGRIQKQTMLLVLSMLLFSFSSFGQAGTTFTARITGGGNSLKQANWTDASIWSVTGTPCDNCYPQNGSDVVIPAGYSIDLNLDNVSIKTLTLKPSGNASGQVGGTVQIGKDRTQTSILTVETINIETTTNSTNKESGALDIYPKGYVKVTNTITAPNTFITILISGQKPYETTFVDPKEYGTVEFSKDVLALPHFSSLKYPNLKLTGDNMSVSGGLQTLGNFTLAKNFSASIKATTPETAATHTIGGDLIVESAGSLNARNSTINIAGIFLPTGLFSKGTSTINYNGNGGDQNAAGVDYYNLQFSGSGTKTATSGLSVMRNLDILSGITFNAADETYTIAADLTNAGTINAGSSTINIGGTFNSTGQFNKGTGNVIYNGNAQSISPLSYYDLTLTRASGASEVIKTAGGAISVSNIFTINTGASYAHNNSAFFYEGDANQNITPAVYYNLTLGGKNTKFATTGIEIKNNFQVYSQVSFESTGDYTHTITGSLLNDGIINNPNTSATNQLNVGGNFTNNGTFNAKAATHSISGHWLNDRTFNSDASTIILNGLNKTITSTITGTGAFNNLTVMNGTSSLTSDITVNGELSVENTILQTDANALILGSTAYLKYEETEAAHVKGNLQTKRNVAANVDQLFGNIGIKFTNSSSPINNVTIKRVTGSAFENSTVKRYYYVTTQNTVATDKFTATMEMAFPAFELIDQAVTEHEVYRKNINSTYDLLPKVETTDSYYNYKLANAEGKYGTYTLANRNNPLPVELTWFKAQRQSQGILLTWETASEQENKGFEVQGSTDGKSFNKVAFVDSKVVNSSVTQRYSYTDNATLSYGTRYYRLAQVDLDGTTTYSNIRAVNMDAAIVAAAAYPNPFAEGQQVAVRLPQGGESRQVRMVLTNTMGQVVLEQQAQVENGQVELPVNTAKANAKGLYLLNVIDNGAKYTFKMIKQ